MKCLTLNYLFFFFFSSRRRHTRCSRDWSSDVCSSDLHECDSNKEQPRIKRNSGPRLSTPPHSRANRSACHNADRYRQGHCVCRSANCHADADSDCYPDRYLRSFHSALSWTSLRRYPRREQDNLGGSSPALLHRV